MFELPAPRYEGTTVETWHTPRGIPSIGWMWVDRAGVRHIDQFHVLVLDEAAKETTRQRAIDLGYPGHAGGWWNYLISDVHEWLAAHGWTHCKCHPRQGSKWRSH